MDAIIRADPAPRTLSIDPTAMLIRSVITTDQPDRAGDVVRPLGLQNSEEFLLNPVVLWAHNRANLPPIGTCAWLDLQPHRVVAETRFAQNIAFAEDIFRLYEQKVLKGWSIGFVPGRMYRHQSGQPGYRIETWNLLEYSAVPIPENPGALTIAVQKGWVKSLRLRDWLAQHPEELDPHTWRAWPTRNDPLQHLLAQ